MSLARAPIAYSVGNENNPGDPFGRSELVIEVDGGARLDHYTRAGHSAWTGRVAPDARDRLWSALETAGFPVVPKHPVPAGSTIRTLAIGAGAERQSAYVTWHASPTLAGYDIAFAILDTVVRQLSEDTVTSVPASAPALVGSIARVPES
jgi:hypothetical protein